MQSSNAINSETIVFGIHNNTDDIAVITIKKEATPPDYIDSYVQIILNAKGYLEYRSAFETVNPQVQIFVSNKETDQIGLWDITYVAVSSYHDIVSLKKALYDIIDANRVFILNKDNGGYILINNSTGKVSSLKELKNRVSS